MRTEWMNQNLECHSPRKTQIAKHVCLSLAQAGVTGGICSLTGTLFSQQDSSRSQRLIPLFFRFWGHNKAPVRKPSWDIWLEMSVQMLVSGKSLPSLTVDWSMVLSSHLSCLFSCLLLSFPSSFLVDVSEMRGWGLVFGLEIEVLLGLSWFPSWLQLPAAYPGKQPVLP